LGRLKTREEIKALIEEGWRFRKKARKGIIYISARKGGKELSLGALNPEYWILIESMIKELNSDRLGTDITKIIKIPKSNEDPFLKTIDEIIRKINQNAGLKCLHTQDDGYCDYLHLENLPDQATQLKETEFNFLFKKCTIDSRKLWLFRPFPNICINCKGYVDMVNLEFMNNHRKDSNEKIKENHIFFKTGLKEDNG
jgi:hypothetical protein